MKWQSAVCIYERDGSLQGCASTQGIDLIVRDVELLVRLVDVLPLDEVIDCR
jgi:hypothetical protein